jgi:protein-S-isoprenylcysteine O-methyltransferase Ste14
VEESKMRIIWMLLFAGMIAYVAWWLTYAIRKQILYEVEMALGVGSLWTAFLAPAVFEGVPTLVTWPPAASLAGKALFCLSIVLFVAAIHSLHRGGKPTAGWEHTTELATGRIHGLVRHPMQLGGILGACAVALLNPTLVALVLGGVSIICFALATRAEDRFNVVKFSEPYRIYTEQVPALNLLAGIWNRLRGGRP